MLPVPLQAAVFYWKSYFAYFSVKNLRIFINYECRDYYTGQIFIDNTSLTLPWDLISCHKEIWARAVQPFFSFIGCRHTNKQNLWTEETFSGNKTFTFNSQLTQLIIRKRGRNSKVEGSVKKLKLDFRHNRGFGHVLTLGQVIRRRYFV